MKPESILQSSLLDIIFETRNKSYGAYVLRNEYGKRMQKAMLIPSMFAIAVFFMLQTVSNENTVDEKIISAPYIIAPAVPDAPQKPIPKVPKTGGGKSKSGATVLTYDSVSSPIDVINHGFANGPDSASVPDAPFTTGGGNGPVTDTTSTVAIPPQAVVKPEMPTLFAEIAPEFPGGLKALLKFLERNIQQPSDADVPEGEMVSVKVKFVIGYDGELTNYEVIQSGGEKYNSEVLRVLKKMPKWIPGKTKGKNVSVWYTIPVKFMSQ